MFSRYSVFGLPSLLTDVGKVRNSTPEIRNKGENDEIRMTKLEGMTNNQMAMSLLRHSCFVRVSSFPADIRHSDFGFSPSHNCCAGLMIPSRIATGMEV